MEILHTYLTVGLIQLFSTSTKELRGPMRATVPNASRVNESSEQVLRVKSNEMVQRRPLFICFCLLTK